MPTYQAPSPVALLQQLIRFDTTNPPGNEAECIQSIAGLLQEAGIESQLLGRDPQRPNLVARLAGSGSASPLLLYGHVDVVTTENQQWQHPPFGGDLADGYIWGRGALDMKGGVAMLVAAFLRARAEGIALPGDVILAVLSDEEAGGDFGARFLVEKHPQHFAGVRYALGEFGGFNMSIGGKRFYPIQTAEKQICWLKATVRGPGGHASMPVHGGAMARLGRLLQQLDAQRLPVHITPPVRSMLETISGATSGATSLLLRQLTRPALTDRLLKLIGERGRVFDPLLHNTVSPTILHGSSKVNVIPSAVTLELDGRLLPGYSPQDLLTELRQVAGEEVEFEVLRFDPGPSEPDMGLFATLAGILSEADPSGTPTPLLLSGVTDGRFFSRLGIQTYGFTPLQLPDDFNFTATIHAADERVPAAGLEFGTQAIYTALQRFGQAPQGK